MTLVWQDTRDPLLAVRVRETIGWLTREMIGENGAFTASLDADSDGEEGKFYVWTEDEIDRLLGSAAPLFKRTYDVSAEGNWENTTILNRTAHADAAFDPDIEAQLAAAKLILLKSRDTRVRPGRDNKILADWNGLTIAALAQAGEAFAEPAWVQLAATVFAAICDTMTWSDTEGTLFLGHSLCGGRLQKTAMIDDYANMANAALALYAATGEKAYLARAQAWVDTARRFYGDQDHGGFFFTADTARDLIVRTKTANDSAVPSGNGSMAFALARLFYLTGKTGYQDAARKTVAALEVEAMKNFPHGTTLLNAYEFLETALQVVIIGSRGATDTDALHRVVLSRSLPNIVLDIIAPDGVLPQTHPAFGKTQIDGRATAYVCRGPVCSPPQTSIDGLQRALIS
jgi:uncharacterized protein YyaL (SSP411 family)